MKYLELTVVWLFLAGLLALSGYIVKDSQKAKRGIEKHLIQRGLR